MYNSLKGARPRGIEPLLRDLPKNCLNWQGRQLSKYPKSTEDVKSRQEMTTEEIQNRSLDRSDLVVIIGFAFCLAAYAAILWLLGVL